MWPFKGNTPSSTTILTSRVSTLTHTLDIRNKELRIKANTIQSLAALIGAQRMNYRKLVEDRDDKIQIIQKLQAKIIPRIRRMTI
jgi:hypothetical protein